MNERKIKNLKITTVFMNISTVVSAFIKHHPFLETMKKAKKLKINFKENKNKI